MCGIYGYVGSSVSVAPLASGILRAMEYRGYDSWGIGWDDGSRFSYRKDAGRVPDNIGANPVSGLLIGHTRWATHGRVTAQNAHPHFDRLRQVGVVHNGVIENINELRAQLAHVTYESETDSEIVAHMVSERLQAGLTAVDAVADVFGRLQGSNAIVVAHRPTNVIVAITSRSPLRIGRNAGSFHLASDPVALAGVVNEVAIVPDNVLVVMNGDVITMTSAVDGKAYIPEWTTVSGEAPSPTGDFPHATIKEIHEQTAIVRGLCDRAADVLGLVSAIQNHRHLVLTGCGSAYYAAALGAEWLSRILPGTWVDAIPASEIAIHTRNMGHETLMLALTQSGETADVVDAIQIGRSWGATIGTLVNTETSTVAGLADVRVNLLAGIERSVLATKSMLAMVTRLLQVVGSMSSEDIRSSTEQAVTEIEGLLTCERVHEVARAIAVHDHVLTLGKGVGHKIALEAALKIKEGSYVHAEAFLTGELKHGPLALVSEGMPCLLFATCREERDGAKIASREVMSRGGMTIGIGEFEPSDCSVVLRVPETGLATVLSHLVVAQLIAYSVAVHRHVDPDYPRNLAKSVTVR